MKIFILIVTFEYSLLFFLPLYICAQALTTKEDVKCIRPCTTDCICCTYYQDITRHFVFYITVWICC